jgi:hypothetical protein
LVYQVDRVDQALVNPVAAVDHSVAADHSAVVDRFAAVDRCVVADHSVVVHYAVADRSVAVDRSAVVDHSAVADRSVAVNHCAALDLLVVVRCAEEPPIVAAPLVIPSVPKVAPFSVSPVLDRIAALKAAVRPAAANAVAQTVVAPAWEDLNLFHFPRGSVHAAHLSQASPVALRVLDDLLEVLDALPEVQDERPLLSVVFQAREPRLCLCP